MKNTLIEYYLASNVPKKIKNIFGRHRIVEEYPNMGTFSTAEFKVVRNILKQNVKLLQDINDVYFVVSKRLVGTLE